MSQPFTSMQRLDKTFWQTVCFRENPENALVDIINALALADDVVSVPIDLPATLKKLYGVDIHRRFRAQLDRLYDQFLSHCLLDRVLSAVEIRQVEHMQRLLKITPASHASAFSRCAGASYRKAVRDAMSDGRLTDDERQHLDESALALGISDAVKDAVKKSEMQRLMQGKYSEAMADKMLSPDEDRQLKNIATALGVRITLDATTERQLNEYRLLWQIRFGTVPTFDPGINLHRGEVCYLQRDVEWHEMRRQRVGVGYAGPTMRVKIAPGLSWRAGALGVDPMTRDALVRIDGGMAFLTNKRLLFMGKMKNVAVKLDHILDVTQYTDGVGIKKDSGKSPVLIFGDGIEIFCATLARCLEDYSAGRSD